MLLRFISFLILIIFFTSCDKFSFSKTKKNQQAVDTIVIFSSVDISPSFNICDSIIDKTKKTDCFRTTIHKKIGAELSQFSFSVKDSISEIVYVDLIINSKGDIILNEIQSPKSIKTALPELDSLLKISVKNLPNIYPAIKRGIPVTTKYTLPIKIELTE